MEDNSVRHGSSKDVIIPRRNTASRIDLRFTNRFSVFDVGPVPYEIDGMDKLRHAIAVKMFEVLGAHAVPTHFIRANRNEHTITAKPFNIYEIDFRVENATGKVIPLEIIDRQELTAALLDRAETNPELSGKIRSRTTDLTDGAPFSFPLVECTTKFEAIDRRLSDAEAIKLARLGEPSYAELCEFVANASRIVTAFFAKHGFRRLDGKWEIAITYDGPSFVVVDSYSPDEMRLIGPDGRSYDKDPLRNWYKTTFPQWIADLDAAKKRWPDNKDRWPKYPEKMPPEAVLDDLRDRYTAVAQAIGAI